MRPPFRNIAALGVLLFLAACNLPAAGAPPLPTERPAGEPRLTASPAGTLPLSITEAAPTPAPSPSPTPVPSSAGEASLRNLTVTLPDTGEITLQDGRFTAGDTHVTLLETAQGEGLAAALLSVNLGGSGSFAYLVTFAPQGGTFAQQGEAVFIEDRPEIHNLAVREGHVLVDAALHWEDEPLCCPTKHVLLTFLPMEDGARLQRVSTFTPDGTERRIVLAAPANFAEVTAPVQVEGRVSVMPFENTLTYRWVTADGLDVLEEGGFMAQPDDPDVMGGSGTFSAALPLPAVPPYLDLQLQILDLSMRDGSALAMDSVWLTVK